MENLDLNQNGTNSAGFGSGEQNAQNQGAQSSQNLQTQNAQSTITQGVGQSQNQSQNAGQNQSTQGFQNQNDTQNSEQVQENASPKIQLLSKFLEKQEDEKNEIESYTEQGRTIYVPRNEQRKLKQLNEIVNCRDDINGKGDELISLELIDTREVKTMKYLFRNSPRKDYKGIEKWDTSKVTCFEGMFAGTNFNEDICGREVTQNGRTYRSWDVSNARTFEAMFAYTSEFNQPIGAHWDTQNVTNMIGMFRFAKKFNNGGQPFGEKWKMDKVEWTWEMFWGAENFNAPGLNEWNMSKVTKCYTMFNGAKAFNQPLDKWDLSNAVHLGHMFNKAESFNQDLSAWGERLGKAQNMYRMFADTKALQRTFAWRVDKDCEVTNITKNSPLKLEITRIGETEQEILQDDSQSLANDTKPRFTDIKEFKMHQIVKKDKNLTDIDYESEINSFVGAWQKCEKDELYSWLPKNIRAGYEIYLAKKQDNEICKADESEWDFICYKVFGYLFVVETKVSRKNDKNDEGEVENVFDISQNSLKKHERRVLNIRQEVVDTDDNDELDFGRVIDYKGNDLYISLENEQEMYIYNGDASQGTQNSRRILNIIGALVLAKAYESKMYDFNKKARQGEDLMKCHREICEFDLKFYQNVPVQVHSPLLNFWEKLARRYRINERHRELQETIERIAQLVSDEARERENKMREKENAKRNNLSIAIAIATAFIGVLSALGALPVIRGFFN